MTVFKPVEQPERSNPMEVQKDLTVPGWPYPSTAESWEPDTRLRRLEGGEASLHDSFVKLAGQFTTLQNNFNSLQAWTIQQVTPLTKWAFTNGCTWTWPSTNVPAATFYPPLTNPAPTLDNPTTSNITVGATAGGTNGPKVAIDGFYLCSVYLAWTNTTATSIIVKMYLTGWFGRFYKDIIMQPNTQTFESLTGFVWLGYSTSDWSVPSVRLTTPAASLNSITMQNLTIRLNLLRPMKFADVPIAVS